MNEIWKFLSPILKPYKWNYVMMFQIPMVAVAFHILNSYALKLIVDTSTNGTTVTKWEIIYPIVIFVGIALFQEIICRAGQWAFNKSQPFISGEIITKAYEYVQNYSFNFFFKIRIAALLQVKLKALSPGMMTYLSTFGGKLQIPFNVLIWNTFFGIH